MNTAVTMLDGTTYYGRAAVFLCVFALDGATAAGSPVAGFTKRTTSSPVAYADRDGAIIGSLAYLALTA